MHTTHNIDIGIILYPTLFIVWAYARAGVCHVHAPYCDDSTTPGGGATPPLL